jgi:uncharacterized protein YegL
MLVLDVSGSMSGAPIQSLQQGINEFYKDIQQDMTSVNQLELGIVTFGGQVACLQEPTLLQDKQPPELKLNGTTKLVDGVKMGIARIAARKKYYNSTGQSYYRPWLVLITDGEPDSDQDIKGLATELNADYKDKKYMFLAIGVQGANMQKLKQLTPEGTSPLALQGLKFLEFFQWLSRSVTIVIDGKEDSESPLPDPDWIRNYNLK